MTTLAPGTYWVGDPCYADAKVTDTAALNGTDPTEVVGPTGVGVAVTTAFGDGTYDASNGRCYSVDSGMLGAVPAGSGPCPDGMSEVTWKVPQSVELDEDTGIVSVGTIEIDTDPSMGGDCGLCGTRLEDDLCPWCDEDEC